MPKRKIQFEDGARDGDVQLTEIEVVLDGSGSMQGIKSDTIGGFNGYIETQKNQEGGENVRLSLVQFNTMSLDVIYDSIPLDNVKPLTAEDYTPGGGTPLLDTVGSRIVALDEKIKSYNVKPSVLFVVITDGEENSSQKYKSEDITTMITEREKDGWLFVFLGANQDAWVTGMGYGMQGGNTLSVASGGVGMREAFASLDVSTRAYRQTGSQYTDSFFSDADKTAGGTPDTTKDVVDGLDEVSAKDLKEIFKGVKPGRFQTSKPNLLIKPSSSKKK